MTKVRLTLACAAGLLVSSALFWAQTPAQPTPSTQWTEQEVRQILRESPWVHRQRVTGVPAHPSGEASPPSNLPAGGWIQGPQASTAAIPLPRGGGGHYFFQVRVVWASSLTVRQAVRLSQLRDGIDPGEGLSRQPAEYVIVVQAAWLYQGSIPSPATWALYGGVSEAKLFEETQLETRLSKKKIAPIRAEFVPGSFPTEIHFYFPRELDGKPVIAPNENEVKFSSKTTQGKVKLKFSVKFNPQAMIRDGRPDL